MFAFRTKQRKALTEISDILKHVNQVKHDLRNKKHKEGGENVIEHDACGPLDISVSPGDGERLNDVKEPEKDEGEETPSEILRVKEHGDKHSCKFISDNAAVVMHAQGNLGFGTGKGGKYTKAENKNNIYPPRQINQDGTNGQSGK